jgi:hypothetical protein
LASIIYGRSHPDVPGVVKGYGGTALFLSILPVLSKQYFSGDSGVLNVVLSIACVLNLTGIVSILPVKPSEKLSSTASLINAGVLIYLVLASDNGGAGCGGWPRFFSDYRLPAQ